MADVRRSVAWTARRKEAAPASERLRISRRILGTAKPLPSPACFGIGDMVAGGEKVGGLGIKLTWADYVVQEFVWGFSCFCATPAGCVVGEKKSDGSLCSSNTTRR